MQSIVKNDSTLKCKFQKIQIHMKIMKSEAIILKNISDKEENRNRKMELTAINSTK